MGWLMEPIYFAISWILLRWHELFDMILPNGTFLGTNWDWVLAIMFLVITVRVILFPIFVKQIRSQRAMQALQPKMKELQQKHKGDQQTLREEMMKLYQQEKVNPLMGCLPLLLQIPVFFGLFHVLKGLNPANPGTKTLYGWTAPAWESATHARLFGAPLPAHFASDHNELLSLGTTAVNVKIVAGILVLIMMATTFMTSRQMILKTGWSADPQQRMIQKLMLYGIPFSLLLSGWAFPIGVIIYWVTQNGFSFGQQYWVLHKYPPPVTAGNIPMKATKAGAGAPSDGPKGLLARLRPTQKDATTRSGGGFLRKAAEVIPPAAEAKTLAPRPGAKPVRPKPAASTKPAADAAPQDAPQDAVSDATTDSAVAGSTGNGKPSENVSKSTSPTIGRMPTVGAAPGRSAGSTANGANGAKSADAAVNGAAGNTTGGAKPTGAAKSTGGAAKSTGGAAKSTTAKKAAPRKGSTARKGGPRR
jgi:YidC/Oxa1 family membrane protein insertase